MADHPDWDASVVWQGPALYAQSSGAIPVTGTVIYSGPVTNWPSLLLRAQASAGGFRLSLSWYLDAALTIQSGNDIFDAPAGQGFYALYEVQAPYLKLTVSHATTSPAAAGELLILPTRSPALGFRPLVTPQSVILNAQSIAAGATLTEDIAWIVIGQLFVYIYSISTANVLEFTLQFLNYDGSVAAVVLNQAKLANLYAATFPLIASPLQLLIKNTATVAVTVTGYFVSQQQGW